MNASRRAYEAAIGDYRRSLYRAGEALLDCPEHFLPPRLAEPRGALLAARERFLVVAGLDPVGAELAEMIGATDGD